MWFNPDSIDASFLSSLFSVFFVMQLIPQADYVVPVEIEWQWHNVYVIKRPGVDNFLKQMGELYEIVVFTASLSKVCVMVSCLFLSLVATLDQDS